MKKFLDPNNKYWFALYTKPRCEFKARTEMETKEIETYLPTITLIKRWSDRKKKVIEPLFKSYIFIHGNESDRLKALQQKTIVTCVHFGGTPATVPESEIDNLKLLLSNERKVRVNNGLAVGARVEITNGAFSGVRGVVYRNDANKQMFAITIELLNRSVVVELPSDSVVKAVE